MNPAAAQPTGASHAADDSHTDGQAPVVRIRDFVDSDAGPLTTVLHEAYAELGRAGLNFTAVDQDVQTTQRRARAGRCWVAVLQDQIVGTITMTMPPSETLQDLWTPARATGFAWLNQLAVSPRERGAGIARRLFDTGLRWAQHHDAHTVGLDTAQPAQHLLDLYARWGFTPQGTIHWDGKSYDSVVLTRPL